MPNSTIPASMVALVVALLPWAMPAQSTGTVVGQVVDSASGTPRRGVAATIVETGQTVLTSAAGRFLIARVPAGDHSLQFRSLGLRTVTRLIHVSASDTTRLTVALVSAPVVLGTQRIDAVLADRQQFEAKPNVGVLSLSAREMESVPRIAEADPVRVVQLSPGVHARNDFSTGFNVHGGESDQNLILLDGYPIYNPFHLGGLFSTFIGATVSDIQLLTGAFPARYGGRLSSVLDVRSSEEERAGVHGAAEVSVLAVTGAASGAFDGGKGSWMVAGRRTYAEKVIETFSDNRVPYHFRDEQAHATWRLPWKTRLSATLYDGRDVLDGDFGDIGPTHDNASSGDFLFTWGNLVGGVTLTKLIEPKGDVPLLRLKAGDSATVEQRVSSSHFSTVINLGSGSESRRNDLADTRVGGTVTTYSRAHDRSIGYEFATYDIRYRTSASRVSLDHLETRQRPLATALHVSDLWRLTPSVLVDGGLRFESLSGSHWSGVSPRLSLKYLASSNAAFTAAVGRVAQWTHSTAYEDQPIRLFDYWRSSDAKTPVSTAWHAVAGHERWLSASRFVRIEAYYKRFSRLLEFNPGEDPDVTGDEFHEVSGTSYGADVLLRQYDLGPFSGWLTYNYSMNRRRQGNVTYAPAQDRRNDLNLIASWRVAKFVIGAHAGYGSGMPYTEAIGEMPRRHFDPVRNSWGTGGDRATFENLGGVRNGARLPATKRLDVHVERAFAWHGATMAPYLSVVNVTHADNVLFYIYDFSTVPASRTTVSQFPLLPSVGVSVVF